MLLLCINDDCEFLIRKDTPGVQTRFAKVSLLMLFQHFISFITTTSVMLSKLLRQCLLVLTDISFLNIVNL